MGGRKVTQPCDVLGRADMGCFCRQEVGNVELGLKVTKKLKLRTDLAC